MASPTPTKLAPFKMDGRRVKCEFMGCVCVEWPKGLPSSNVMYSFIQLFIVYMCVEWSNGLPSLMLCIHSPFYFYSAKFGKNVI